MDDAPFELVDKDGECLTVRCTGCGTMHDLPPLPFHLECSCGNEAEFVMASPDADLASREREDDDGWEPSWN